MQKKIAIKSFINFILSLLTFIFIYKIINQRNEASLFYFLLSLSSSIVNAVTLPLNNFYLTMLSANKDGIYEKFNNLLAIKIGLIISSAGLTALSVFNEFEFSKEALLIIGSISITAAANVINNFFYAKYSYHNKSNLYENLTLVANVFPFILIIYLGKVDDINFYIAVCCVLIKALIILIPSILINGIKGINLPVIELKKIFNEIKGLVTYSSISRMSEVIENIIIIKFGFNISSFALSKQISGAFSMIIDRSIIKICSSEYFRNSDKANLKKYRIQVMNLSIFFLLLIIVVLQIDLIKKHLVLLLNSNLNNIELALIGCIGLLVSNYIRFNIEFINLKFARIGKFSNLYKYSILVEFLCLPIKLILSYIFGFIGFLFSICFESFMIFVMCNYKSKKI